MDATAVAAPKLRNGDGGKIAIKAGAKAAEIWPDKPVKAWQKGEPGCATDPSGPANDARWAIKYSKAKPVEGKTLVDIALPGFGYKSHVTIDRAHGMIRRGLTSASSAYDGARLREGFLVTNTSRAVRADSAYRSAENEGWLRARGFESRIHCKKPKGNPMPLATSRANGRKSMVRPAVEHVFAQQKARMGLVIRTVGLPQARPAITLANISCNVRRMVWLSRGEEPGLRSAPRGRASRCGLSIQKKGAPRLGWTRPLCQQHKQGELSEPSSCEFWQHESRPTTGFVWTGSFALHGHRRPRLFRTAIENDDD